jgi:hypothetical protein
VFVEGLLRWSAPEEALCNARALLSWIEAWIGHPLPVLRKMCAVLRELAEHFALPVTLRSARHNPRRSPFNPEDAAVTVMEYGLLFYKYLNTKYSRNIILTLNIFQYV